MFAASWYFCELLLETLTPMFFRYFLGNRTFMFLGWYRTGSVCMLYQFSTSMWVQSDFAPAVKSSACSDQAGSLNANGAVVASALVCLGGMVVSVGSFGVTMPAMFVQPRVDLTYCGCLIFASFSE